MIEELKKWVEILEVDADRSQHDAVIEDCNKIIKMAEKIREIGVKGMQEFYESQGDENA